MIGQKTLKKVFFYLVNTCIYNFIDEDDYDKKKKKKNEDGSVVESEGDITMKNAGIFFFCFCLSIVILY
jgi:hypothetical protein